jgi:hypothetical protein
MNRLAEDSFSPMPGRTNEVRSARVTQRWSARWSVLATSFVLAATVVQAKTARVAVLGFKSENGSNDNDDWTVGLADFVELALQKEGVETLERRQIRLVLGERELQSGGMVSGAELRGRGLPAVNYFVSGSVRQTEGNEFELTVSIVRADNARLESSFTRRGFYPAEWLSAIDSLAKEAGGRLRSAAQPPSARSEFESLTWLPEAALPFFKGLEYYARGDYPLAAGWFRTASARDPRFDQARLWEARALRQFGFPELAEFALAATRKGAGIARTNGANLPVVAVIAPEDLSVANRAAFVHVLKSSGRFELFEPQAIGDATREMDLQLTGQLAAPTRLGVNKGSVLDNGYSSPALRLRCSRWFRCPRVPISKRSAIRAVMLRPQPLAHLRQQFPEPRSVQKSNPCSETRQLPCLICSTFLWA